MDLRRETRNAVALILDGLHPDSLHMDEMIRPSQDLHLIQAWRSRECSHQRFCNEPAIGDTFDQSR